MPNASSPRSSFWPLRAGLAAAACALFAAGANAQSYVGAPSGAGAAAPAYSADAPPGPIASVPTNPPGAGSEAPRTRAEVKAELARLRQAGYDPQQWWDYPENLQEAQRRVQVESAGGVYSPPAMPVRHSSGL